MKRKSAVQLGKPISESLRNCPLPLPSICKGILSHIFPDLMLGVQVTVFPVVTYQCESWTIKKAEHQRTDAFEQGLRRLKSPLDSKEIKPVILKEINPDYSLEGLKGPKLWPPDVKSRLTGKDPDAEGRRSGRQRVGDGWMAL